MFLELTLGDLVLASAFFIFFVIYDRELSGLLLDMAKHIDKLTIRVEELEDRLKESEG